MGELVRELDPLLRGAGVREVAPLPPRDVLLILDPAPGPPDGPPVLRLRLSAHPEAARLHLQQGRAFRHKGAVGPFFERLARELVGASIRHLEQVGGDRLALVEFSHAPGGRRRALLLELFGRRANLVLLGPDDEVLDVCVPAPARQDGPPRLAPGQPWTAPGGAARAPREAPPAIAQSFPDPADVPPGPVRDRAPLSWRVECALGALADDALESDARKKLVARAKRKLGRAQGLVRGLEQRAAASDEAERVRQDGELLKAALSRLRRGMDAVELEDWFSAGAPPRRIALDPRRSPQANVQRTFERYKKLERARASVADELARAEERVAQLERLLAAAHEEDADAAALDAAAVTAGLLDQPQVADLRKRKAPPARLPYRSFTACDGSEIRVGRTAKDNDALTFKHARGNDVWLHTADCPGSHVILRLEKGREPDEHAVLDAAYLAVHFSPARDAARAPVHVARRKLVHKPRGAKPGLVTLSGGRVLEVRVQQARLDALLRSARGRGDEPRDPRPPGPDQLV